MSKKIAFAILVFAAMACAVESPSAVETRVETKYGTVSGVNNGAVTSFKGIPYAAAPVGTLRWRAPQAPTPWKGILKADHFGSTCMQGPNTEFGPWTKEFLYIAPNSEDCLYLNIWTPKITKSAKLPVLVFIHGGAFRAGSADVPIYDGEQLANTGMVILTINYRLGAFGFFAHPDLTAESEHHSSGNYGLLDQLAALKWVKENIEAFGGDPDRVAIAGQSAGARSVWDLVASPLSRGLFHAAIADSGINGRVGSMKVLNEAERLGVKFAAGKHVDSIEALRALPAKELLTGDVASFAPIVDGWVLPASPSLVTTEAGKDMDVPIITGFQHNDSDMSAIQPATVSEYQKQARRRYGAMFEEFLKLYPALIDKDVKKADEESARDRFRCGMYFWASSRSKTHKSGVYTYYFDRAIPWPAHPEFGAFHTGEIPYTFGNLKMMDRPWEPIDFEISKMMMTYWKNMASKGNPNGDSVPRWNPVDPSLPAVMRLGAKCEGMVPADAVKLEFWKRYFASAESANAPSY